MLHYLNYEERARPDLEQNVYSKFQCPDRRSSASSTTSTGSSESGNSKNRNKPSFSQMSLQLLASTFHKNWTEQCSNESGFDDSLTNLNWLHNVNPIKINEQLSSIPYGYPRDKLPTNNNYQPRNHYSFNNQNQFLSLNDDTNFLFHSSDNHSFDHPDYKNNPNLKPPFAYAVLISWAMKDLGKPKITLSDIYGWIVENFAYYRYSDSSWQNSVRHNLSLGKCFEKVPRRKDEPGKGGFWRINPQHLKALDSNLSKIKYSPNNNSTASFQTEKLPIISSYSHVKDINIIQENPRQITNNPAHVKRSRKSPIRATSEHWDSEECFNNRRSSSNSNSDINNSISTPYKELMLIDDSSTFHNDGLDFSSIENSSCDSYKYLSKCPSNKNDIAMSNFDEDSLGDILTSPMLLDKEEIIENDDFKSMVYASDFSDLFPASKDDLHELNSLLGIY